ncbi:hypothetical protein F5Y16DRAFT_16631 [Xylariaceae sp. FL0255]|nr:hypothetical protein F5Y16DRAFT_16631 [Xylariaceae sp. FL0255]
MPGSSTHDTSPASDSSINKPPISKKGKKKKLTGSDSSGSKKKDKNAKDSGGVLAAVTKNGAKFTNGGGGMATNDATPSESPLLQSPELKPSTPASIPTNGIPPMSPLLNPVSATPISTSTAPSANDWGKATGHFGGSPSNLISIMGDSPPTQPSSYEDSRGLSSYAWGAHQQQQRHYANNNNAYSASPPNGVNRRPLSFHKEFYAPSDLRSQASSPPSVRRSSLHSPFPPPRVAPHPPLPHQPQAHFYGAPEIDFDLRPKTNLKAGERGFYFGFDTLPRSKGVQTSGNDNVVLAGYEGGLDMYTVSKKGVELLSSLKGLRGGVYNAKILPWNSSTDQYGIYPLIAVVVHGPVPPPSGPEISVESALENSSSPRLDGVQGSPQPDTHQRQPSVGKRAQIIDAYQTSVEVYSLTTNRLVAVLLQAPETPIKTSVTSPVFRSPPPSGAFQIRADDGHIVVSSGTTGECWIYRQVTTYEQDHSSQFFCIGKLWTSLQSGLKGDSTPEEDGTSSPIAPRKHPQTPILSVNGRWLAYCPPAASSQHALNASICVPAEGKQSGLLSHTSPVLPNETSEVDQPISDSVMNRIMRETTQEFIHGARWVGKHGMQLWNNYWKNGQQQPPARQSNVGSPPWGSGYAGSRNDTAQFPPTYGIPGQAVTKDPGLVSIVDLHSLTNTPSIHPITTFKTPLGCSFLSFSPSGLSLFTASNKGDVQTVWDLMRIQHTKSTSLQNSQPNNGHAARVRQIAQFSRMTVARIVDVAWAKPNGERAAMVTERGTVHLLDMPPSAYAWPPPRRRTPAPEAKATPETTTSSAVSIASNALSSAYVATRPLINRQKRSSSNSNTQTPSTIMDHASYGGKVLAAGISHSLGNAGTAINQLRHTGENRVSLPLRSMSAGISCAIWITGRKHHTLFVVGDGLVRTFPGKSRRPSSRKDGPRVPRGNKYADFKLRDLPDDVIAPSMKHIIDPIDDLDFPGQDHEGGNTLVLQPRLRAIEPDHSSAGAIPQAEIESNAPYQPFHTDRRVGLYVYSTTSDNGMASVIRQMDLATLENAPKRSKRRQTTESKPNQAWAFGERISVTKLNIGLPPVVDEDISNSIDDHRALPVSAMERVLQKGENDEQIVVTTRRRRGGNRAADVDEDGFFEDDCEVLDFADQRV